jgi:3-hydroxybutyrate dehydrogenase
MLHGFADAATIDARRSELCELGVSAAYHATHLRGPTQIVDLIQTTTTTHGSRDILVNNAVVRSFGAIENSRPSIGTKSWRSICPHRSIPFASR